MNNHKHRTVITSITNNDFTTGTVTTAKVYADRIDEKSLRKLLFPEKKVILEQPPTIDQMVASALSRLHVSINAEVVWAKLQISKDFNTKKIEHSLYEKTLEKYPSGSGRNVSRVNP